MKSSIGRLSAFIGISLLSAPAFAGESTAPFLRNGHEVLEVQAEQNGPVIATAWVEVVKGGFKKLVPLPGTQTECGVSVSSDGGKNWTTPEYYHHPGFPGAFNPHVVVTPENVVYAVCLSDADDYENGFLNVTKSTDLGKTWSPWREVAAVTHGIPDKPTMTYAAGRLTLTYSHIANTPYGMKCRMKILESDDEGRTWARVATPRFPRTPKTIDPSKFNILGDNTIYALGSRLTKRTHFLWGEYKGDVYGGVWFATKKEDGRFTRPIKLSEEVMDPPLVSLYASPDERNLLAVWYNAHARSPQEIAASVSRDGGRTWSKRILIAKQAFNSAALIGNSGSFVVSYTRYATNAKRGQNVISEFTSRGRDTRVVSEFDFDIENFSYIGNTHALLPQADRRSYLWLGMEWFRDTSYFYIGRVRRYL